MSPKVLALLLTVCATSTTGSNLRRRVITLGHVDVGKVLGHANVGKNVASTAMQQNVASTTGSNLRRRATLFDHGHNGHDGSNDNNAASTATQQNNSNDNSIVSNKVASDDNSAGEFEGTINFNKKEYDYDDPVSIDFALPLSSRTNRIKEDLSNFKIGIFMRMANPQDGTLDPVVALPLCPNEGSCTTNGSLGQTTGSVTFSYDSMMQGMTSEWPIDLYQWGTGFDAYVLDESGADVVGPFQFNIMMNETS